MIALLPALLGATVLLAGCATRPGDDPGAPPPPAAFDSAQDEKARVGEVLRVAPGENADWVLLNAGFEQHVRPGMNLTVRRQGKVIASLVVAETTANTAAALILDLTSHETIRPGDTAHLTTN